MIDEMVQDMQRFDSIDEMCARITARLAEPEPAEAPVVDEPEFARTRFLNFRLGEAEKDRPDAECAAPVEPSSGDDDAIAWLGIVEGAGRGQTFPLGSGAFRIGRGERQEIQLAFGDNAISRKAHATVVYYGSQRGYLIRDGLKPNPVLLNGRALQGEAFLKDGDRIRLGETTLQFTMNTAPAQG